jgi:hypothetical protein
VPLFHWAVSVNQPPAHQTKRQTCCAASRILTPDQTAVPTTATTCHASSAIRRLPVPSARATSPTLAARSRRAACITRAHRTYREPARGQAASSTRRYQRIPASAAQPRSLSAQEHQVPRSEALLRLGADRREPETKVIQARLGHTTITETMGTHGHLFPDAEDLGRESIDAVLGETPAELERNWDAV